MNKKLIIGLGIIFILLFSGCSETVVYKSQRWVEIEDTGSEIDNIKACYNKGKKECDENPNCLSTSVDPEEIICEEGRCIC